MPGVLMPVVVMVWPVGASERRSSDSVPLMPPLESASTNMILPADQTPEHVVPFEEPHSVTVALRRAALERALWMSIMIALDADVILEFCRNDWNPGTPSLRTTARSATVTSTSIRVNPELDACVS
jgi:hypothetical protein